MSAEVAAEAEFLTVIVDCNPSQFADFGSTTPTQTDGVQNITFGEFWQATCQYLAHYIALFPSNLLIVILAHADDTRIAFRGIATDCDLEKLTNLLFDDFLTTIIHSGLTQLPLALAQGLACLSLATKQRELDTPLRIFLIMMESPDQRGRQNHNTRELITLAFSAKNLSVTVDVASGLVGSGGTQSVSSVWKRVCLMTYNGLYLTLGSVGDIRQWGLPEKQTTLLNKSQGRLFGSFLCFYFLCTAAMREFCAMPAVSSISADSGGTCTCHNRPLSIAYVCTSCFSIHCQLHVKCRFCDGRGSQTGF